jgi:hypothetical protein
VSNFVALHARAGAAAAAALHDHVARDNRGAKVCEWSAPMRTLVGGDDPNRSKAAHPLDHTRMLSLRGALKAEIIINNNNNNNNNNNSIINK